MRIKDFKVEQWMNEWETKCTYNVAETCTYSVTLDQLFDICGGSREEFMDQFAQRRLTSKATPPLSRASAACTRPCGQKTS